MLLSVHKTISHVSGLAVVFNKGPESFGNYCIGIIRLDALALSVIATATWLAGWVAGWVGGCHTPVLYQNC